MGDPRCPRCNSSETRRVRNYGRPVGNEWQCLECQRRWDTDESIDWRARALAAEKVVEAARTVDNIVHKVDSLDTSYDLTVALGELAVALLSYDAAKR
jgi:transcriptional regulator NrdR family protein